MHPYCHIKNCHAASPNTGARNVGMTSKPVVNIKFYKEKPILGLGQHCERARYRSDSVCNLDVLHSAVRKSLKWTAAFAEVIMFHSDQNFMAGEEVRQITKGHVETLAHKYKKSVNIMNINLRGALDWDRNVTKLGFELEETILRP